MPLLRRCLIKQAVVRIVNLGRRCFFLPTQLALAALLANDLLSKSDKIMTQIIKRQEDLMCLNASLNELLFDWKR